MKARIAAALAAGVLGLIASSAIAGKPLKPGSLYIPTGNGDLPRAGRLLEFDASTGEFKRLLVPSLGNEQVNGVLPKRVYRPAETVDIAATLAADMKIKPPFGAVGTPLKEVPAR